MQEPLKVISTFTGVGGMDLGLERAGMRVVMQCELDPWRRRLLAQHWPDVPCCPDIRLLGAACADPTVDDDPESPTYGQTFIRDGSYDPGDADGLVGGFPCQDVSVAGKRAGLAGRRTGLFFEFARCADEFVRPGGFILLENVPGLLSSHGGRDFAVILATLAELGFHDVAWRVLDSRHFGVPQRRRRVFILGRRARGRFCASVLLELDGGAGHPEAGREAWQRLAAAPRLGAADAGRAGAPGAHEHPAVAATLSSGSHASHAPGRRMEDDVNLVADAVTAKWRKGTGGPAGDECQNLVGCGPNANDPDVAGTLGAFGSTGGHKQDLDAAGAYVVDSVAHAVTGKHGRGTGHGPDELDYVVGPTAGAVRPDAVYNASRTYGAYIEDSVVGGLRGEGGGGTPQQLVAADGVREAPRREPLRGRGDLGASRRRAGAERDGAGGHERGPGGRAGGVRDEGGPQRPGSTERHGERAEGASGLDGQGRRRADGDAPGDGHGPQADANGVRAPAGLPGRLDDPAEVDAYALRGRGDAGLQAEATDLPNLVGKVGKGGGGMDGFIHDRRDPACVHPDAVGRDGVARADSPDAEGVMRKRDAGLGVIDDGTAYTLGTGAPPAVGPVAGPEAFDTYNQTLGDVAPTLPSAADAGGFNHAMAFLPRHFTRAKDGAPGPDVPPLTTEMDRGDGHAMVHYGFQSTLGSLSADGIEEDACPPVMSATPPAAAIPARPVGELLPESPYDPPPDGPRYAAMGDAVTVPVLHWIGARFVAEAEAHGGLSNVPTEGAT